MAILTQGGMRWRHLALAVSALAIASCGGEPRPTAEIGTAQASIDAAAHDGASQHDPQGMILAQNKLDGAQQAMDAGDNKKARRLAEEADVDARYAAARSRTLIADQTMNPPRAPTALGAPAPLQQ